jgi:NADH-quinone oxidoreductase subunit J
MLVMFYLAGAVAIVSTALMVTRLNAVHALLYLVVSLLAVAVMFFTLGAPFVAALEVIIYAGAIMVLFVFVVMLLNLGERATAVERQWLTPSMWVGPAILAAILIAEVAYLLSQTGSESAAATMVGPKQVGLALFGPYLIGVELASLLLMSALVGAYHLGVRQQNVEIRHDLNTAERRTTTGGNFVRAGAGRSAGAA